MSTEKGITCDNSSLSARRQTTMDEWLWLNQMDLSNVIVLPTETVPPAFDAKPLAIFARLAAATLQDR